jgi:hypothetical protein
MPYEYFQNDPRRSEIVERRIARFFSDGGICDRYEHRGDKLIGFHEIFDYLVDKGLRRDAVTRRFLFSARNNGFGRHGARQTIESLIDLDDFSNARRGLYSLRPGYLRVETYPRGMRARRSVWAGWPRAQGWPVPPELEAAGTPAAAVALPSGIRTNHEITTEEKCKHWLAALPAEPRLTRHNAHANAKEQFQPLSDKAFGRAWAAEAPKKGWDKHGRPRKPRS